ncbi:hypothetical protein BDP27DRAFT_432993 [Rhodocollybia butyracea]|uniref:Uncharacterized protein n=1 Tax=Rhodocollybia butyracea TaxID=206335 RepID=A0A9P5U055_9AGAR|nr:hypothetical protein BDP27DRAFT_432993 [Rhodocollybia butyracea]
MGWRRFTQFGLTSTFFLSCTIVIGPLRSVIGLATTHITQIPPPPCPAPRLLELADTLDLIPGLGDASGCLEDAVPDRYHVLTDIAWCRH